MRFRDIHVSQHPSVARTGAPGHSFAGYDNGHAFSANFPLFLISEAQKRGCSFEELADGFGPGMGTMGGDWGGIRDSSDEAVAAMLERALNHLFGNHGYDGRPA